MDQGKNQKHKKFFFYFFLITFRFMNSYNLFLLEYNRSSGAQVAGKPSLFQLRSLRGILITKECLILNRKQSYQPYRHMDGQSKHFVAALWLKTCSTFGSFRVEEVIILNRK